MEIDLNPGRIPSAEPSQPIARQDVAAPATDGASFQASAELQERMKHMETVRPEKMQAARALLADSQYPPNDVLDRIAILIASHILS